MTKIYLVKFINEFNDEFAKEAFTNNRKALSYKRYWDAIALNEKYNWKIEMETLNINEFDYTNAAIKEEAKQLPY